MITPISQLARMKMSLYGGVGNYAATPSYVNGYNMPTGLQNSVFGYSNLYNIPFSGNSKYLQSNNTQKPIDYSASTTFGQTVAVDKGKSDSTTFKGLTNAEAEVIKDYYNKHLEPSESLVSAATSGAIFGGLMMNPRVLAHPWNTLTSFGDVKEMFKGVTKSGTDINKLWKKNHFIMEEAYSQMQRAKARSKWKIGLFRKRYTDAEYKQLKGIMEKALKSGQIDEIAKATETLRHAYSNNGGFFKAWNWTKGLFGYKAELPTVDSRIKETAKIDEATNKLKLYKSDKMTFKQAFERTGGKTGLVFGLLELVMSFDKIKTAFDKDGSTGMKQLGQSTFKAAAHTAGWALGETAGIWAFTKLGATIGTALGPGVGTVIGAVAGFIGGSIGCWAAGKAAKAVVGQDVANKITTEKLAKTEDGRQAILQEALAHAQDDKNLNQQTAAALNKAISFYA